MSIHYANEKTGNLFKDPPIVGTFKVILKACQFFIFYANKRIATLFKDHWVHLKAQGT